MVSIKNDEQIKIMREAGRICALAHKAIEDAIAPGISTMELSNIAEQTIKKHNAIATFRGMYGFPEAVCISINDEVIHGIPSKKRKLSDGDVVSVDIGATYHGYVGDAARTHLVGNVREDAKRLLEVTKAAFYAGMNECIEGNRVGDISAAVESVAIKNNIGVVRDYVGHGVGAKLHEDPEVPNFATNKKGIRLYNGMTVAIEPMFNLGTGKIYVESDDWTVRTADGKISCHFENSVALTKDGPIILTAL